MPFGALRVSFASAASFWKIKVRPLRPVQRLVGCTFGFSSAHLESPAAELDQSEFSLSSFFSSSTALVERTQPGRCQWFRRARVLPLTRLLSVSTDPPVWRAISRPSHCLVRIPAWRSRIVEATAMGHYSRQALDAAEFLPSAVEALRDASRSIANANHVGINRPSVLAGNLAAGPAPRTVSVSTDPTRFAKPRVISASEPHS